MTEHTEADDASTHRFGQLAARLRRMLSWIDGTLPWRLLLLVATVGVALHVLGVVSLPIWPFTTAGGNIHVDSPEVYTRERLVNDRYEQDYWLRDQLRQLNEVSPDDLASGRFFVETQSRFGESPSGASDSGGSAADPVSPGENDDASARDSGSAAVLGQSHVGDGSRVGDELDFRARYEALTGIRDMLRQQILENMLDDRHDLTANSVYGLKFDTTVIPGNNTRRRAFVEVEVKPVDLFLREEHSERDAGGLLDWISRRLTGEQHEASPLGDLANYQRAYLCTQARLARRMVPGCDGEDIDRALRDYKVQEELYFAWLEDIEKRLNAAEESLFKSIAASQKCPQAQPVGIQRDGYAELIGKSLEVVLNLPRKRFIIDHPGLLAPERPEMANAGEVAQFVDNTPIRLPEPYSNYMQIDATPIWEQRETECALRVNFVVASVWENYTVARTTGVPQLALQLAGAELIHGADLSLYGDLLEAAANLSGMSVVARFPACPQLETHFWRREDDGGPVRLAVRVGEVDLLSGVELLALSNLWEQVPALTGVSIVTDRHGDHELLPFSITADGSWQLLIDHASYAQRGKWASVPEIVYEMPGPLLHALVESGLALRVGPIFKACPPYLQMMGGYAVELLPSGLFNFIESMSEVDAYAYAVFPKNDVRGILATTEHRGSVGSEAGGVDFMRRLAESRTEPLLVGYGESPETVGEAGARPPRSVRFGWVIASPGKMEPSLKTQLALISVPAWTDRLNVTVTTGWLNRAGKRRSPLREVQMEVMLPPDYGAFDSIFRDQGWVTPAPRIRDQEMDREIYVVASQDASILIPGSRLWRSTSVTLGSQPADRIRVLPNMEGIIAEFRPVRMPLAKYRPDSGAESGACSLRERKPDGTLGDEMIRGFEGLEVRPVRLRVWTSEGMKPAAQSACVIYDPTRQVREAMSRPPKPGSGAWTPIATDVEPEPSAEEFSRED